MMLAQTIAMSSRQFIYAFDEETMHVLRAGPEWKIYGKFVQSSSLSQPGWAGISRQCLFLKKIRGCLLHEAPVAKRAEVTVGREFEFVVQILIQLIC